MELVSVLVGVVIGLFGFLGFILIALWGDNREMTKRRKIELSMTEAKLEIEKRLEKREKELSIIKGESALARDVRMNPRKFAGVGEQGIGRESVGGAGVLGEKPANPAMFSSHKPSCPNHPMNRNRVGGKNVPRQMGVEVHMIEVPEFLIDSLIEMQNESSTKNPRTNVRKSTGTKKTTNARSKAAKKGSRSKS